MRQTKALVSALVALIGTTRTDASFLPSFEPSFHSITLIGKPSRGTTTKTPAFHHRCQEQEQHLKSWRHHLPNIIKRKHSPSSKSMTTSNGETNPSGGSHFIDAGKALISAADAAGSQDYACPHLLRDIGLSLQEIGESWSTSWEAVTYSAYDAAGFFASLSQLQKRQKLATAYRGAAGDLGKISSISGCVSVGPPSSAPVLESLSKHLKEAAEAVSEESATIECKDSIALGRLLKAASASVGVLASEYD